jgi:hypothetical protein
MPTLSFAAYPSLAEQQFAQVAQHLTNDTISYPPYDMLLIIVCTPASLAAINNPLYTGRPEGLMFGIWNSQRAPASFSATLDLALKAAGLPTNSSPLLTTQIDRLQQTIYAGKEYERFGEPQPTLLIGMLEDQTREQFDQVMEQALKRRGHGGRHRQVAEGAGLPSGAQLMVSSARPGRLSATGWMTISIWNLENDADQFRTDFTAASQAAGVPNTDEAIWIKCMIHTLIRPAG